MGIMLDGFSNRIVLGLPKTIKEKTYIPLLYKNCGSFDGFGSSIVGNITPKILVVINSDGTTSYVTLPETTEPYAKKGDVLVNKEGITYDL
ncbi:MAG TPA: hypothetical protein GX534_04470 [Thermoanaerobacterales bacterium]|nr:hypothetical protein [Thermoanaerobacterales bacterium]